MLKIGLLCGVIMAMSASGISNLMAKNVESKSCDTRFIVELNDDIESITREDAIDKQDNLFKKIKNSVNANSEKLISYSVLNNAIVVSGNKEDAEAISKIDGVKNVYEDTQHIVERTESDGLTFKLGRDGGTIDVSKNASAQTMEKPDDTNDGEGTLVAILDNEFYFRGKTSADANTPYHHEVYDPLASDIKKKIPNNSSLNSLLSKGTHAQKKTKNIQLGNEGSLWFNSKVPFYYDYAGDSHNGSTNGAVEDYNVASNIGLHGSHVSSIAAANAENYKGIAPKAQLACMKVFTDVFSTPASEAAGSGKMSSFSETGFLSALEDAILIGADVINVSIGSDLDDFDVNSLTMRTLEKLADEGVCSAISAGNAGKSSYSFTGAYGNWTRDVVETGIIGSFANNSKSMIVAAGQPDWVYYENALRIGEENVAFEDQVVNREGYAADFTVEHKMTDLNVPEGRNIDWVYVPGFGTSADYTNLEVDGKIAVVNRGSIDFSTKYLNAKDAGAIGVIIINNDPTASDFNFRCSFGDVKPTLPVALVLFKDKPLFQNAGSGTFTFISKKVADNKLKRTISDYSSDGARYDLDLKPEITTPGSNIRGAVWPQNKEEKETPYAAYEYFNGTSMAAPNYAGAVSVLVSKLAKEKVSDGEINATEEAELKAFRKTVNMRFMSTAVPMYDNDVNGENGVKSITSPRMQGAGMANIKGAYNTDVYLAGTDADGSQLDKAKILLRNREDIAKGDINLSFYAINEGANTRTYDAKVSVMRPATVENKEILTGEYNFVGEVSTLDLIPGTYYYDANGRHDATGTVNVMDAVKVSKDIEYYLTQDDYDNQTNKQVLAKGYYYVEAVNGTSVTWSPIKSSTYQSVKDIEIANVDLGTVTVPVGTTKIDLNKISLSEEAKNKIAELYTYGCYIEGYVSLDAQDADVPDLSIPYLGFYSLTDKDASRSFDSAPVVEPFSFEKDPLQVYPSDLVNDVTKQLLGKDNVDFSSMWLAGYASSIDMVDKEEVLVNNKNFDGIDGFDPVGTKPVTNNGDPIQLDNPGENIYVGNPQKTNTMIIQQFVLRSVKNNFFTITNKATGEVVYKSALEDMLFGDTNNAYALFKSHVDANYLGAGYVAHRAYAVIPLYNPDTKVAFASGDYEIKFNYQLAATGNWVSKAYGMHIDSDSPIVSSFGEYTKDGVEMVRMNIKESHVAYAIIGSRQLDVQYDSVSGLYYADVEKSFIKAELSKSMKTSCSKKRLFVKVVDYARGETGAIVHFEGDGFSEFTIAQGYGITKNMDFKLVNGVLTIYEIDEYYEETEYTLVNGVLVVKGNTTLNNVDANGCEGSVISSCIALTMLSGLGVALLLKNKRREELGGNK